MAKNDRHLPKKLIQGKTARSQEAQVPVGSGGGGGKINVNFQEIKWTPKKLILAFAALGIPYSIVLFAIIKAGYTVVAIILVGVAIFVGAIYFTLRFIENGDI